MEKPKNFWPIHVLHAQRLVFEPTESNCNLYLTVSSFTTVVFLIERVVDTVWLTFTVCFVIDIELHLNFCLL